MKKKNWKIIIEASAKKELHDLLNTKIIDQNDIQVLKKWVSEIEENGPNAVLDSSFWNDHPLHSDWKGYRSSSFSYRGRIIYKVINEKIVVQVVRVTADHDYRR